MSRAATASVTLIDGPSGSGKTDLALRMRDGWVGADIPQLLQLESIYPGWDGLAAASRQLHDHVLVPWHSGGVPRWRRWDWELDRPAEWHVLDPARPLIVEGCGALSRANAALAEQRIWVQTDDQTRKRRALERDGELYAPEWERWDAQWRAFVAAEDPRSLATAILLT
jgi:hypothetical protein